MSKEDAAARRLREIHGDRPLKQTGKDTETRQFRKTKRDYDSFPFGKHKGEPLHEVPTSYLVWFVEVCDDDGSGLYQSVENELWERPNRD